MRKILSILLVLAMLFTMVACSSNGEDDRPSVDIEVETTITEPEPETDVDAESTGDIGETTPPSTTSPSPSRGEGSATTNRVDFSTSADSAVKGESGVMSGASADSSGKGGVEDSIISDPSQKNEFAPGTLTAGEWKDLENVDFWKKLLNRNDWYALMEERNLFPNTIVPVKVTDDNGNPCYNAKVSIVNKDGKTLYSAVSDVNGNAYLLYNLNGKKDEMPHYVVVGEKKFPVDRNGYTEAKISKTTSAITELDLMLMVDTTGSMGDELSYLQTELENVIKQVSGTNKAVSINISVNFYRDDSDEYIVKPFEFTNNISDAILQLNAQRTDGGGDYPEAVHKALNNVINEHQWRNNAVKLCFFVMDAPPHSEQEIQGINSKMTQYVKLMAEKGVRLIPVASSGINTETEFLLRSWSVMTGGTYVFLTDHSGIGGSHLEPTIGDYKVEKLNELMIRVIGEYLGNKTLNNSQK